MRLRRVLDWYGPLALAVIFAGALGTGMVLALARAVGEPLGTAPASVQAPRLSRTGRFHLVALGDSITHGTGDERDKGYAARVAEALRERGVKVSLRNLAVPGAETEDLLRQLANDQLTREVADADLVVLSIGGNDLTHALRAASERIEPEEALARARANLREIAARVRTLNASVPVRMVGLYNPFEILPAAEPEARAQLAVWNGALETATHPYPNVLVVPIADLFADRPERLAADRFHPGPKGHALIAERLMSTLPDVEPR